MMTTYDAYTAIMKHSGATSERDLAKKLGVSQNCVWQWFNRGRFSIPGAKKIEALTHGKVKAATLLPIGRLG